MIYSKQEYERNKRNRDRALEIAEEREAKGEPYQRYLDLALRADERCRDYEARQ